MAEEAPEDEIVRRFARDRWVRLHGTPRITVLVGDSALRQLYRSWMVLADPDGKLLEGLDFGRDAREAVEFASEHPTRSIAIATEPGAFHAWRTGRSDRLAVMVDEGVIRDRLSPSAGGGRGAPEASLRATRWVFDARSAAEAAMYEALESTPATAGRFSLNERLSIRFGPTAAEVDLLSREDQIAIEIDGIHHFEDVERYRRDRRKDLLLQTQGLLVIRLLAEDVVRDPREAIATVCAALAYRRSAPRGDR